MLKYNFMIINFYYKINNKEEYQTFEFKTNEENLLKVIKNDDTYILDKSETLKKLENLKIYESLYMAILGWEINNLHIELSF